MKVPKLWRKKRPGGRYYGAYLATIAGADVNLGTADAELAQRRLVEALRGKRGPWPSDAELAADALEADIEGAAAGQVPPTGPPSGLPPANGATAAAPPAPVVPDHIEPPRALPPMPAAAEADARAEAEATNAAAAETAGSGAAGQAEASPLDADALEGILQTVAQFAVEGQLWLQAWIIERKTGLRPEPLPEPSDPKLSIRVNASKAWVAQFERWFPNIHDEPPWMVALALPLAALPYQLTHATPVEKTEQKQPDPQPAQAAA